MTVNLVRGSTAAFILSLAAHPAFADLTAQDVWSDWKNYLTGVGYDVSANESSSGGGLTVSDLKMSLAIPESDGSFSIDISQITFTENGDGTVNVVLPSTVPVSFVGKGEDGEDVDVVVDYDQTGSAMVVSGQPDDMRYNYTASQVDVALASLKIDGQQLPDDVARFGMTITNVISSTQMSIADMRNYSQRMSADALSYDIAFDDPESDDQGAFSGSVQGIGFDGTGSLPLNMDTSDFRAMLDAGFALTGAVTYDAGSSSVSGVGDGEQFSAQSSSQGGSLGVTMNSSKIAYDASQKQTAITVSGAEIPFPIEINMALAEFKLDMPVAKSDEQQDFGFAMTMGDFTMSDMIWGMFDPQSVLPRDPATIALDLSGKAKVLFDFLDPKVAEMLDETDEAPGELHALTINNLLVQMVGARLSGTGDFTFDNSDTETFDGMPRPIGAIELELIGANGLIDKLIQMGFVSDQDAMGARMMLGMLAVPGDAEDTLTSKIEINEQGHILANGQRIQ